MKSIITPGLLKCNTEAAEGREVFGKGRSRPLECQGLHDHSAVGVLRGVAFPKLSEPKQPLCALRDVGIVP